MPVYLDSYIAPAIERHMLLARLIIGVGKYDEVFHAYNHNNSIHEKKKRENGYQLLHNTKDGK